MDDRGGDMEHRQLGRPLLLVAVITSCGPGTGSSGPSDTGGTTGTTSSDSPAADGASSQAATDATADGANSSDATGVPPEPSACTPGQDETACPAPYPPSETYVRCGEDARCESYLCDSLNCGGCGNRCIEFCVEGVCASGGSECIDDPTEATTCAEVCGREDAECEDRLSAQSGHLGCDRGYNFLLVSDFGTHGCAQATKVGNETHVDIGCNEPISWAHGTPENPMSSISCCCKGDIQ